MRRCIIGKTLVGSDIRDLVVLAPGSTSELIARFFGQFSGDLRTHPVDTQTLLDLRAEELGRGARLVTFGSDIIVSARTLSHFRFGAYNLHPGPPSYPGWAPEQFAAHDQAAVFGATAHQMIERVDAGPIVGVEVFPVARGSTAGELAIEATKAVGRLLLRLGPDLVRQASPLAELSVRWGENRGTKAKLAQLRQNEQVWTGLSHEIFARPANRADTLPWPAS